MNKLVIAVLLILAGYSIAAFTPPDAGVSGEDTVAIITFENGWTIDGTSSTNVIFIAP
jgi:hypothetical protein